MRSARSHMATSRSRPAICLMPLTARYRLTYEPCFPWPTPALPSASRCPNTTRPSSWTGCRPATCWTRSPIRSPPTWRWSPSHSGLVLSPSWKRAKSTSGSSPASSPDPLRLQHDLAEHPAVGHGLQCRTSLRERITAWRWGFQPSRHQLVQTPGEQRRRAGHLMQVLTPGDPEHADIAQQQPVDLDRRNGARRETDDQQLAVDGQHADGIAEGRPTNRVDHDVH